MAARSVALLSFRFGPTDGVSVEAGKWARILERLGFRTYTVAAEGADRLVPGLGISDEEPPEVAALESALADADLVVVENLCSLPLNPAAGRVVADRLRGRPALLHHHDLAWQRPHLAHIDGFPPDDPSWRHVTINDLSRRQLADRGVAAVTIPNGFDTDTPPAGDRDRTRDHLGLGPHDRLLVHPTRAIPRKNVAGAIALAEGLDATYWLLGPAEDGYGPHLDHLLATASVPVIHGPPEGVSLADAYAAADAVALPSTWEGFGNATIEAAVHRRPLAIGNYPVAREIAAFGFRWFPADDPRPLRAWLDHPDETLHDANLAIARRHFSLAAVEARLCRLLQEAGWLPDPA
ncbi:MAG: mannosylglucosylglycerate synthase [Actinomycetota bacterium]|nr:mannosylglucosylglycerate synthase [Actinomycetota bacterium]